MPSSCERGLRNVRGLLEMKGCVGKGATEPASLIASRELLGSLKREPMSRVRLELRVFHGTGLSFVEASVVGKEDGPARGLTWLRGGCLRVVRVGAGPGARRDMESDEERVLVDDDGRNWLSSSSC